MTALMPDIPPSPAPSLSRRLWAAGLQPRYPSFEKRVVVAGWEEGPKGMALIRARSVSHQGQRRAVTPFFLDRSPVTNAQYRDYLLATGAPPPHHWTGWRAPRGYELHPVVGITLDDARAYAALRKARLPTELEWVSAVRGPSGERRFPWGEMCDGLRCHCPLLGHSEAGPVKTHPSGSSPEGVEDLYGNVWEWTEASEGLSPAVQGMSRVLGGSFAHRCTAWTGVPTTEVRANKGHAYVGFRCAADVPQQG